VHKGKVEENWATIVKQENTKNLYFVIRREAERVLGSGFAAEELTSLNFGLQGFLEGCCVC
jgi:hypothetical protein